ncbi:hypothetical protein IWZ00DRAFT_248252 [Phyllosticta capitalensis]
MSQKLNPEQEAALEWLTENSRHSEDSRSMQRQSPGPSRGGPHWSSVSRHANPSPRPTQAPHASASNNPYDVLDTNPDADSPESSSPGSAGQATPSPTPQRDPHSDNHLNDLGDNGHDQQPAAPVDPYQNLDALEGPVSRLSVTDTSPQNQTQFPPPIRGQPSPRGRGSRGGRGQAGRGQYSRGQSSRGEPFRGQSTRGQSARGQSIHGGGRPTYSAAGPSRGYHGYGRNHHSNAGPSSQAPSWPGSPNDPRGSDSGPGRGASSRVPSSPGNLRSSRGPTRQTSSGPIKADNSILMRVDRPMSRFLCEHKDKHGSYPPRLHEIASLSNTHVQPFRHGASGADIEYPVMSLKFDRASGDAVQSFKEMFDDWSKKVLEEANPRWADAPGGYIAHVERARAKAIRNKEQKEKFCQPRPDGVPDPTWSVSVEWTADTQPGDILGPKHTALDPIRKENCCWITCKRENDRFVFTVEGDDQKNVFDAAGRLEQIAGQAKASRFNAETAYILDVADGMDNLPDVRVSDYYGYSTNSSQGKKPQFVSPASPVSFARNTGQAAMETLIGSITAMTDQAQKYRSWLEFRASLGTFVMLTYPANLKTTDFDDFSATMEEHRMRALVTKEIGDPRIESPLLQRLCGATHLLVVPDIAELTQKPIYSATFKFNNQDRGGRLMLRVELSYAEGSTTVEQRRWYRLKQGNEEPRKIIDVNLVNLSQGFAWHLGMTAAENVEESSLSEDYRNFPDSLSLNTEDRNFLVFGPHGGRSLKVPLHSVYQKRLWRIETKFGYWFVEVAGGQETTFSGRDMTCDSSKWTLNVLNREHEGTFSSNANLDVGKLADWGHDKPIEGLFPWEESEEPPPGTKMTTSFKEYIEGKGKGKGKANPEHEETPRQKKMTKSFVGGKGKGRADPDDDEEPPQSDPNDGPADLSGLKQLLSLLHGLHDVVVEGYTPPSTASTTVFGSLDAPDI